MAFVTQDAEAGSPNITNGATDRILHWIETSKHTFSTDSGECQVVGSTIESEKVPDGAVVSPIELLSGRDNNMLIPSTDVSSEGEVEPSFDGELVGCENDALIPSNAEINTAFFECQIIWSAYTSEASSLPTGWVPAPNPQALLQRVPPLPQSLPKARSLTGQSLWHIPCPELADALDAPGCASDARWNPDHVHGPKKRFPLFVSAPTECRLSSESAFSCPNTAPSGSPSNGIAILTVCWAYIFSARFLEMQKRAIRYSPTKLSPMLAGDIQHSADQDVLYLDHASNDLIRWMCALLTPGLGWLVTGPLPPWTTNYNADARFVIAVSSPFSSHRDDKPPSSAKAMDLLNEFCALFGFGSYTRDTNLDQPTAGFLSALMLPFSNYLNLQPHLPRPVLRHSHCNEPRKHIQLLFSRLPFYMTLVIRPESVGSLLWSIFWQAGIECNLASAWLGSIRQLLGPLLKARDWERLAQVLMLREPQRGSLWLGLLLHGDTKIFDMLISYLESHEERYGFGSLSRPDIDICQWTGLSQSFLDKEMLGTYEGPEVQVAIGDLLRHRFDFRLGDPEIDLPSWEPCGKIGLSDIEPELWPRLEQRQRRKYLHWVWWLDDSDGFVKPHIEVGFKSIGLTQVQGMRNRRAVTLPLAFSCTVNIKPSVVATRQMIVFGSRDAVGNCISIAQYREHHWLAGIRL